MDQCVLEGTCSLVLRSTWFEAFREHHNFPCKNWLKSNFVGLLHHFFWLQLVLTLLDITLLLSICRDGQLRTSLYDKCDDFNFHITNFPFLSSTTPSSPAYGVFISQLIRYARTCSSNECFILRAVRLFNKLFGQGYVKERWKSSLRKFYGRYGDLT